MTKTRIAALRLIEKHGPISVESFTKKMWPLGWMGEKDAEYYLDTLKNVTGLITKLPEGYKLTKKGQKTMERHGKPQPKS